MAFDLKNYEDVQSRVKRWQEAYPMGRIVTEIVEFNAEKGHVLIKASCYRDDETLLPAGVDYAFGNVAFYPTHMKRFFIEDTSTSAIGRCISLVLPGDYPKATLQDMSKVERPAPQPVDSTDYWAQAESGAETIGTAVEQLQQQGSRRAKRLPSSSPTACNRSSRLAGPLLRRTNNNEPPFLPRPVRPRGSGRHHRP